MNSIKRDYNKVPTSPCPSLCLGKNVSISFVLFRELSLILYDRSSFRRDFTLLTFSTNICFCRICFVHPFVQGVVEPTRWGHGLNHTRHVTGSPCSAQSFSAWLAGVAGPPLLAPHPELVIGIPNHQPGLRGTARCYAVTMRPVVQL